MAKFKGTETTNARIIPTNRDGPKTQWRIFLIFDPDKIKRDIAIKLFQRFGGKFQDISHSSSINQKTLVEIGGLFPTKTAAINYAKAINKLGKLKGRALRSIKRKKKKRN